MRLAKTGEKGSNDASRVQVGSKLVAAVGSYVLMTPLIIMNRKESIDICFTCSAASRDS